MALVLKYFDIIGLCNFKKHVMMPMCVCLCARVRVCHIKERERREKGGLKSKHGVLQGFLTLASFLPLLKTLKTAPHLSTTLGSFDLEVFLLSLVRANDPRGDLAM